MKIFVTGATGFIGTEVVKELVAAGHQVRGLTRSEAGARQLVNAGVEAHHGNLKDLDSLRTGATGMDAVVHLAFSHDDMTKFAENGQDERLAIEAIGSVLQPGTLFVVTSATGMVAAGPGHVRLETDPVSDVMPRNPETAARAVAERGIRVAIVRLPQVHDTHKQGFVTMLLATAREKGLSAYVGEGKNRWAAAPLPDVAHLYHLAVQKTGPGVTVYHAVQEEGVSLREIAETLGKGLNLPVKSLNETEAAAHFTWLAHFASLDMPASSSQTRSQLDWNPTGPGLIEDLNKMSY